MPPPTSVEALATTTVHRNVVSFDRMSESREENAWCPSADPAITDLRSSTSGKVLMSVLAVVVAGLFLAGAWIQQQVHLNHDVGWIVHSARWMLEGRRFGSDIVDVNPPLIWFLSMPAAFIVKMRWLAEPEAIRLYMWLLCLGSLALCHYLLAMLRRSGRGWEAAAIIFGIAFACAVLSGNSFGQREFLAFILGMPYCLAVAGRIEYGAAYRRGAMIVCGMLGGIAFGFKPWLLSVPVLLEVVYLVHSRDWRKVFRVESLAMAVFLVAYVLATVVLTPDYFTVTLPLARAVYWMYGRTDLSLMWAVLSNVLGPLLLCALAMLAIGRSFTAYARVLCAAGLGYALNYWMQHKGFDYHLYPAMASSVVLVFYAAVLACRKITNVIWLSSWIRLAAAGTLLLILCVNVVGPVQQVQYWFLRDGTYNGWLWQYREATIRRVRELAPGGDKRVFAFSTHPYPAFPTMNYVDAEWSGRQLALISLSGVVRESQVKDPVVLQQMKWGMEREREMVIEEFLEQKPDVVLVTGHTRLPDDRPFDYIAYFATDARFADRWRSYHEVKGSNEIRMYVRNQGAAVTARNLASRGEVPST